MGMFDTIHFPTPIQCPNCGREERSLQTKEFGQILAEYKIGSMLHASPVVTGIVKESLWCSECYKTGGSAQSSVYLVIWHSVLAGVEQDLDRAEARLRSVDRLDLLGWLDEAQREAALWKDRYYRLHGDLRRWHEYGVRVRTPEPDISGEEGEKLRAFQSLFDPPPEILSAADPLLAILEANTYKTAAEDRE